jgi:hypothetical protein
MDRQLLHLDQLLFHQGLLPQAQPQVGTVQTLVVVVAGGVQNQSFQLSFNASLNIDFQGSRLTSNGVRLLLRELDERLGFGDGVAPRRLTVLEFRSWVLD